jgi:hypothetical protein
MSTVSITDSTQHKKYKEGSDYMEGMVTVTVHQNRLIEMRGPNGITQSRKTQTIHTTCQEDIYHFGFNVICRAVDGVWFLSKKGSGRGNVKDPQDLNLLSSIYYHHG